MTILPRRSAAFALALGGVLVLAGCAAPPRPELTRMQAQVATARAAADPLFDDLAITERRVGVNTIRSEARAGMPAADGDGTCAPRWTGPRDSGFVGSLCASHMPFESAIGDPPGTAQLRRGLATLSDATAALLALAENRNVEEAQAQVDALAGSVSGLISVAATPFGPTSGAAAALKLLDPVLVAGLEPLTRLAVGANNAERVRRLILQHKDDVNELIARLKSAIPAMYQLFAFDAETRVLAAPSAQQPALRAEAQRAMNGYRRLLSDYGMLLDGLARAWAATVAAAEQPAAPDLAAVNAALADARIAAETVRRAQAAFRAGG